MSFLIPLYRLFLIHHSHGLKFGEAGVTMLALSDRDRERLRAIALQMFGKDEWKPILCDSHGDEVAKVGCLHLYLAFHFTIGIIRIITAL